MDVFQFNFSLFLDCSSLKTAFTSTGGTAEALPVGVAGAVGEAGDVAEAEADAGAGAGAGELVAAGAAAGDVAPAAAPAGGAAAGLPAEGAGAPAVSAVAG